MSVFLRPCDLFFFSACHWLPVVTLETQRSDLVAEWTLKRMHVRTHTHTQIPTDATSRQDHTAVGTPAVP